MKMNEESMGQILRKTEDKEIADKNQKISIVPWLTYFLITSALLLATAVFLQFQISSHQRELVELRRNLSNAIKSAKMERKRSFREVEIYSIPLPESQKVQAVHLHGSVPFQHIQKEGRIGPWALPKTSDSFVKLKEFNTEIEIIQNGLYFIYAQVYYLTSEKHNSFQILLSNGTAERKHHRNLSTCSSQGSTTIGEVSCYTAFVKNFSYGDGLYLNQVEQNRLIHFNNGCSYFGIVLLQKT